MWFFVEGWWGKERGQGIDLSPIVMARKWVIIGMISGGNFGSSSFYACCEA